MAVAGAGAAMRSVPGTPGTSPRDTAMNETIRPGSPNEMPPRLPPQVPRVLMPTPGSTPSGQHSGRPTQSARGVRDGRRDVERAMARDRVGASNRGPQGVPENSFEHRQLRRIFAKKTKLEARYQDLGATAPTPRLPPCHGGNGSISDGAGNSIVDQFLDQLHETAPAALGTALQPDAAALPPKMTPSTDAAHEAASWLSEAAVPMHNLVNSRGSERLGREVKELKAKVVRLERERNKLQDQCNESQERVKQLEDDIKRIRQDPQMLHPAVQRLRKVGLNTPALADLNERWAGYVLGRTSMAMEVGSYAFRAVFATHAVNGVLTEDSFKSVIRQFEPTIKNDQLTRLWFFADSDGSGQLDLFEFMRMFGCNANGDMSDEYYEVVTMHMYRKFHSKGGIRRVYASADRDQDQCLNPEEWEIFLSQCKLGLSRQDFNMTKQEMNQVFQRMNTSMTGLLSITEFEAALEAAASKCFVSEKWVRDTFHATAVAVQDEGINIRQLIPTVNLTVKEFRDLMLRFTPRLRLSQLDRLWKYVVAQTALAEDQGAVRSSDGHRVDTDAFLRVAFCPTLGAASGSNPSDVAGSGGDSGDMPFAAPPPGTGKEVLEQLAVLLRKHTGDVPLELCFDSLDPFLTPDHFHKQLVSKFGLQYDTIKTKQMFSLIDMDRDGKITRYEFLSMFKRILQKEADNNAAESKEVDPGVEVSAKMRENRLLNRVYLMESELKQHRVDPMGRPGGNQMYGEVISTVPEKTYHTLALAHAKLTHMLQRERDAFGGTRSLPNGATKQPSIKRNGSSLATDDDSMCSSMPIADFKLSRPSSAAGTFSMGAVEFAMERVASITIDHSDGTSSKRVTDLEAQVAELNERHSKLVRDFDVRVDALLKENEILRYRIDTHEAQRTGPSMELAFEAGSSLSTLDESSPFGSPRESSVASSGPHRKTSISRTGKLASEASVDLTHLDSSESGSTTHERKSSIKHRDTHKDHHRDTLLSASSGSRQSHKVRHSTVVNFREPPQHHRQSQLISEVAVSEPVGPVRKALRQFAENTTWPLRERITGLNDALLGAIIEDRFRIDEVVSVSNKVVLTACWDLLLDKVVSARLLYDLAMRNRRDFSYEVSVMSKLMSVPHIPSVYHFSGANSTLVFFAMELLQGETLASRFLAVQEERAEPISNLEAMEIADALLYGMDQCHQQDVVNLSIRPDTIWIAPPLSAARVRILSWENAVGINGRPINVEFAALSDERHKEMAKSPPKLVRGTDEADIGTATPKGQRSSNAPNKMYANKLDRSFPNLFLKDIGSLYYMPTEHLYSVIDMHETESSSRLVSGWCSERVGPAAKVDSTVVHWWQRGNGLVMTDMPVACVPLGRLFEVEVHKIMTMVRRGTSDLGFCIGLTTMPPATLGMILERDWDKARRDAFFVGGDCSFYIRGKRLIARAHAGGGEEFNTLVEGVADTEGRYINIAEGLRRGDRVGVLAEWNGDLSVYVNGEQVGCCPAALRSAEVFGHLYGIVDLFTREGADEHYVRAVSLSTDSQLLSPNFGGDRGAKKAQELRVIHELVHTSVETPLGLACDVYACGLVLLQCFRGGRAVPLPPGLETFQVAMSVWINEMCPKIEGEYYFLAAILGLLTEREPSLDDIDLPKLRTVLNRALKKSRYSRLGSCWEFSSLLNQATGWQDMNSEFLTSHIVAVEQAKRRCAAEQHLSKQICKDAVADEHKKISSKGDRPKPQKRSSTLIEEENSDESREEDEKTESDGEEEDESWTADKAATAEVTHRTMSDTPAGPVVAVWDLQPFTLGHSHLTRAVQVVTEWDQKASIKVVAVRAMAMHIPEQLQMAFVSCFNTKGTPHHGKYDLQQKKKKRNKNHINIAMRADIMWQELTAGISFTDAGTLPTLMLEDLPLPCDSLPKHRFPLEVLLKRHLVWMVTYFVENLDLEPGPETICGGGQVIGDSRALISELATAISRSRVLKHLNLRSSGLCEHGGLKLAAAVKACPQLQWLDISNNKLGPKAATKLVIAADQGNSITFLDLSRNEIGDTGVQSLSEPLSECKTLHSLRLGVNGIGEEGSEALAKCILTNTSVTNLNLCHNRIDLVSTLNLIRVTEATCTLKELDLEHNLPWPTYVGSEAVLQQLADCLGGHANEGQTYAESQQRVSCLISLSLRHNNVRSECAAKIFEAIAHNTTMERLNISWNGIRHGGTLEIAKMLAEPRSQLRELDLRDNKVGTQDALGYAFQQIFWRMSATDFSTINRQLLTLHLGNNELTANSVKLLVDSLPALVGLQELLLYHNPEIGQQGGQAIARLLSPAHAVGLPSLRRLNIAVCGLGDVGCKAVVTTLKHNDKLSSLDISGNHITDNVSSTVAEALRVNRTLKHLSLGMSHLTANALRQMMDALSTNEGSSIEEIDVSAQAEADYDSLGISDEVLSKFVGLTHCH